MSKEIFNSKETLLAAGEIITVSERVAQGKLTEITEIEDKKIRELIESGINYKKSNADKIGKTIGEATGGVLGIASGYGLIALMAAEGTAGAASLSEYRSYIWRRNVSRNRNDIGYSNCISCSRRNNWIDTFF